MALVDTKRSTPWSAASDLLIRARQMLADQRDGRAVQILAGNTFLIRAGSALLALALQVLLARWMGSFEFGIYVYAWTWVLIIGAISDVGLSSAARRFIPEYTELKDFRRLRGFLAGSRWLGVAVATLVAIASMSVVTLLAPRLDDFVLVPLYLACLAVPIYGLVQVQGGIAQSYDWPNLALMPFYIWRQLLVTALVGAAWLFGLPTNAMTAMAIAVGSIWAVTLVQFALMQRRLSCKVPAGPKIYEARIWIGTSLPIFVVEAFYLALTYVDIIVLEHLRSPEDVAVYYAAARLLAIVAFVYFAIAGATTHRFSEYYVAGDRERLAAFFKDTVRWTFWPSLIACAGILVLGKPLLALFGPEFETGYGVMFILAIGMMARAAVGPAERLLNMVVERKECASVYGIAFLINLALCVILVPQWGIVGAAVAVSSAIIAESIMFCRLARRRLGLEILWPIGRR
ncbi:MAG TPA: lipopolysaccharide biosynthesis protein [Pseudolabrys sp.]|nr:lipopolysaccharide biosynthesis protein [Pseudolabrys sp.]